MDFFVWQGVGGVNSYVYSRRAQRGQAEKDAISWCVMGWDWYYILALPAQGVQRWKQQQIRLVFNQHNAALGQTRQGAENLAVFSIHILGRPMRSTFSFVGHISILILAA